MTIDEESVRVHVNLQIQATALTAVVANAKKAAGPDPDGYYRVDTADALGELISVFLRQADFESYAENPENYRYLKNMPTRSSPI